MLLLYHNDMSTCSKKVRLVLAEKSIPWESKHLNLRAGETRTEDYMKNINPNGVVPSLIVDGKPLIESTVIMEYLDDTYPEPPLRPADTFERAQMRLWMKKLDEGLHADIAVISNAVAFRYQHMAGRNEAELKAYIDAIPDAARREAQRDLIMNGVESARFKPSILRWDRLFGAMEAALDGNEWIVGDSYSLADIAYTPYLTRFEHLSLLGILDARPNVRAWYDRVRERPSYEEALRSWFNEKYLPLLAEKGTEAWPKVKRLLAEAV